MKKKEEIAEMPVYEGPLPRPANQKSGQGAPAEEVENPTATSSDDPNAPANWDEAQSPEGYTYYWNTISGGKRESGHLCRFFQCCAVQCSWGPNWGL